MKNLILFTVLGFAMPLCAQTNEMLGDESYWTYVGKMGMMNLSSDGQTSVFTDYFSCYELFGSTEINGKTYRCLNHSVANAGAKEFMSSPRKVEDREMGYLLGIRESEGRVFVDSEEYDYLFGSENVPYEKIGTEYLIYDFNLSAGDSFGTGGTVVESVKEVTTDDGVCRKLIVLSSGHEVMEGVGCLCSTGELVDYLSMPVLQWTLDNNVFHYTFLSKKLVGENLIYSTTDEVLQQHILAVQSPVTSITPNPFIYDLSGRKVSTLSKGVYIQNGKKIIIN